MKKGKKLYEGKAKIIYATQDKDLVIQYFKDDATAFNAEKKAVLDGKGVINNRISEFMMKRLDVVGIPNHFIRRLNMREQLIKKVDIIPLEVIVRNVAAGSLTKRLGVEEGTALPRALVEFSLKNDELGDPVVSEEHIACFNWATPQEMDEMIAYALRINDFMSGLFAAVNIRLVDFKIEFGRHFDGDLQRTILADEISPDSCRLWDFDSNEKLDKDRFRRDLGGVTEAYSEVARRLGILKPSASGAEIVDFQAGPK